MQDRAKVGQSDPDFERLEKTTNPSHQSFEQLHAIRRKLDRQGQQTQSHHFYQSQMMHSAIGKQGTTNLLLFLVFLLLAFHTFLALVSLGVIHIEF